LSALGLWQQGIYLIHNRVAFDVEMFFRVTEQQAKQDGEQRQNNDGAQNHYFTKPAKPKNAMDISPAVISVIGAPWNT